MGLRTDRDIDGFATFQRNFYEFLIRVDINVEQSSAPVDAVLQSMPAWRQTRRKQDPVLVRRKSAEAEHSYLPQPAQSGDMHTTRKSSSVVRRIGRRRLAE